MEGNYDEWGCYPINLRAVEDIIIVGATGLERKRY